MITFERRVPEQERERRAARCIDDVIDAEEKAKRKGYVVAAGAAGLAVGGAALGAFISSLGSDE
jgi:hypothetical protein